MEKNKESFFTSSLSQVHPFIAEVVGSTHGHHKSEWFTDIFVSTKKRIEQLIGKKFTALIFNTTPAGGRDAFVGSCLQENTAALVFTGSRFAASTHAWSKQIQSLGACSTFHSAKKVNQELITKAQIVFLDDVDENGNFLAPDHLAREIKKINPHILVVADLTTSFGCDEVAFEAFDGVLLTGERALMGIPGTTLVCVNSQFMRHVETVTQSQTIKPFLFNLQKTQESDTSPFSPNISSILSLQASLQIIESNGGMRSHVERQKEQTRIIRSIFKKMGFRMSGTKKKTNAFSLFALPTGITEKKLLSVLQRENIILEASPNKDTLKVGHTGYIHEDSLKKLFTVLAKSYRLSVPSFTPLKQQKITALPASQSTLPLQKIFTIPASEFITLAEKKAAHADREVLQKVTASAQLLFKTQYTNKNLFPDRMIGFIGSGNIVRETIHRCLILGLNNIIIYSPSLAKTKQPAEKQSFLRFCHEHGIIIARKKDEVFLQAHTVVLLTPYYSTKAAEILRKSPEYVNKHFVNAELLKKVKEKGKMDVLINAAAREELVDKKAIALALKEGWLRYFSDEMPSLRDPRLRFANAWFTGHVGGSPKKAQERVAENTHEILKTLVKQMLEAKKDISERKIQINKSYRPNLINAHLATTWAYEKISLKKEIRILITDPIDIQSLHLEYFKRAGISIQVRNIGATSPSEKEIIKNILEFAPHIILVRSRTLVTEKIINAGSQAGNLGFIIRTGVGVDNLYPGLQKASKAGIQLYNEPYGNSFAVAEMVMHFLLNSIEPLLLAPGPTKYVKEIFSIFDMYTAPESPFFRKVFQTVSITLQKWTGSPYEPILVAGPGTALMEATVANLTAEQDTGFVISHGRFGERFLSIIEAKNRRAESLRVEETEWGKVFSPTEIASSFKQYAAKNSEPLKFLCLQQNETSSGAAYTQKQLEQIVASAREFYPDIIVIIDAISGLLAHELNFNKLNADALIWGSQKGMGVAAGLAFVSLSSRARQKMLGIAGYKNGWTAFVQSREKEKYLQQFETTQKLHYLNLLRRTIESNTEVSFPAVFHIFSSLRSLEQIQAEGGEKAYARKHKQFADRTRQEILRLGLRIMTDSRFQSNSVTPVLLPKKTNAKQLRGALQKQYGIEIAGSQGDYWKDNMVRIGHFGLVNTADMARLFRALNRIVNELSS